MSKAGEESFWLRFVKRRLRPNLLVKALSGVAVIWCFLPGQNTTAIKIHRTFRRQCWVEDGFQGACVLAIGFVFWLPTLAWLVGLYTWRCGYRVRRQTGIGMARQILGQLSVACRFAVPPPWFYMFEFYRPDNRRRALEYLYRTETKASVYHMLRRRLSSRQTLDTLSDKALFAGFCQTHGLHVLSTLATASGGVIKTPDGQAFSPTTHVFFKPRRGAGGRGASRWLYQGDGHFMGLDGTVLDAASLKQYLSRLSGNSDYIVRPYVTAHPDIARISGGALSTARIVTCIDTNGRAVATHAVLRMARHADVVVDNFHCGGIAAAIDLASGRLGKATDMGLRADSQWYDAHPLTGATIRGTAVPHWAEALEMARRAHDLLNDQIAVGWDIAVLDDGAYLVEGNKGPDLDIIQRVCQEPVGNSRLGESLLYHLELALEREKIAHQTS